ncbi:MAG: exodeoxyribonuclease III [Prochloraceae cyanobacterium]|nr:exodeoxyribonuclease III [Prochloraceae cyanobacterium]
MKVATWNVNSIRTRQEQVIGWLKNNPTVDVLCLQETKVVDKDFPKTPFEELNYHLYISGQKAYNGVAIFSRKPMEEINIGFAPIVGNDLAADFDAQKRVISGTIDNIRIVNLYVPNGSAIGSDKYEYKLKWFQVLRAYLAKLLERSPSDLCVCGDFNVALEDKDIYNPKGKEKHVMASPAEREALKDVLTIGLKDVFRKFNPEGGHYSWWDYRHSGFAKNRGWRIDHHYLTPELFDRALSCQIDLEPRKLERPSDHTPVIVEF